MNTREYDELAKEMETNITKLRDKVKESAEELKKLSDDDRLTCIYLQILPKVSGSGAVVQLSYMLKKFVIDPELV